MIISFRNTFISTLEVECIIIVAHRSSSAALRAIKSIPWIQEERPWMKRSEHFFSKIRYALCYWVRPPASVPVKKEEQHWRHGLGKGNRSSSTRLFTNWVRKRALICLRPWSWNLVCFHIGQMWANRHSNMLHEQEGQAGLRNQKLNSNFTVGNHIWRHMPLFSSSVL